MAITDLTLFETFLQEWRAVLSLWAQNGTLKRAAQDALQLEGEPEKLRELVGEWSQSDFRNLPPVVLLPAGAMPGAVGAYAISTGTIYLNQDWLASVNKERVISVLTEELGHHLDGLLNEDDTPGDEGEAFSALFNHQGLSETERLATGSQNDSMKVSVNNTDLPAESASATAIEALNKLLGIVGIPPPSGDKGLLGECVSFVKRYTQELGIFMGAMGGTAGMGYSGGAEHGFRNFNVPTLSLQASQADKITYTGSQVPQIGDIIFFDNSTWGHVAVIQSVLDANRVIVQESNTDGKPPSQSRVVLREINLKTVTTRGSVMGWLRLKNITIGGNPSLPPISNPSLTPITTTQLPLFVGNINGDGQKDIVFRRPNGDIKGVLLDSEGKFNWALRVGSADKNLPLVGIGDINGDGRDDVVFRAPNGDVTSFRTNSSGAAIEYYRVGGADANLPIIGVSDISGDGRAEVIFRAPNGDVNAFRNGADGVAFQYYRVGGAGSDLPVVAIGDISGDRRSEILFRAANGDVNAFRMGADGVATQYYRVGFADPSIKLVGIGDITGDGRGEVIFRAPNGDVGAFLTSTDGVATLWYVIGWADPSLPIVGIGDTTGDGRSEIFFRQPNGFLGAFRINSSGIADLYYQTDVADPAAVDFGYSTPTITAGLQTEDQSGLGLRVPEGNSGFSAITFDVSVDNATGDTVFVNYATENGTAIAGIDYSPVSGTLAFTSGQKVKQVSVQILADSFYEPDKSFRFVLSNAVGGSINNSISEVIILNDDIANGAPTSLSVSATAFNENIAAGSTVVTLTTTDPDAGNTFTYSLVSGNGDTDNSAFSIAANQLSIKASPNFEAKNSYSVRVRSTDQGGLSFERPATFTVINLNEAPTALIISATSFNENIAAGSTVVTLTTTDPDAGNTFTYSLVSGSGDTDNNAFSIAGNQLSIKASPDFEAKSSYSIRIRSTDQGGLSFERAATLNVIDVSEPVITFSVSPTSVIEDGTSNLVYTFSRTGVTTSALTVNYTVGGTATLGTDYTGIAATPAVKTVTFAANSSTATLTVDPTADTTIEANETVALTLATGTGYTIGTTTAVTGTILNDDLVGTTANNTLNGSAIAEFIDGRQGQDTLTGGAAADVFGFSYGHSSLLAPDRITDLQFGADKIDLFNTTGGALAAPTIFSRAANNSTATTLSDLAADVYRDANGSLTDNQPFAANAAALVVASRAPIAGTYLLINNSIASRDSSNDLLINITGYSGSLPGLGIIPVASVFA